MTQISSRVNPAATSASSDRDGKGATVTADLDVRRINIETEGDIVVGTSSG